MVDLYFEIAGDQIDGARDYQEDAFLTTYIDDDAGQSKGSALVVMADGMGGHAAGNIASNLVVSTFNKNFTGQFGKAEASGILNASLLKANDALSASIKETPALDGMGCTMVTAVFTKGKVYWVSVGDSHLYVLRDQKLDKKNEDHSYGGYLDRMKAQGVDVEAEAGLSRNMLMSAMTGDEIAEIDCPEAGYSLMPGDRLLVASDGLDTLSPGVMIQTSAWSQTPKECVQGLLKAVEEANKPRQDNTTVIVIDVLAREPEPVPAPVPEDNEEEYEEYEEGAGRGGLIIAVVVVALLAIGGGAFFVLGGKDEPAPDSVVQVEESAPEPEGVVEPATPEPVATAQPEPEIQEAVEPEAEPATVAARPAAFRDALTSGSEAPEMVTIAAGSFLMGSKSVQSDERPQHKVTVAPFAMSKYEATFKQYEAFASATGRKIPDNLYLDKDIHPVLFVSWDDAYAYTQWLSTESGQSYRLSSEAEWEYAARAGSDTTFAWGFDVGEKNAHCFDCKTGLNPRESTRIGRFKPNAFGLHDAAGNVFEWVHDCYHPTYDGAPTDGAVWEGGDCAYRVARGGAYTTTSKSVRPAKRTKFKSRAVYDSVGIRVARDL